MDYYGESTVTGDLYVLDQQNQIICVLEGIKFHAVPRSLLNVLLAPRKRSYYLEQNTDVMPAADSSGHPSIRTDITARKP